MDNQAGRITGTTILLLCLAGVLFVGVAPILNMLHATGALPSYTVSDVVATMERKVPGTSFRCQRWVDGWDFICVGEHTRSGERVKYGVRSSWRNPVVDTAVLPLGRPTPSYKAHLETERTGGYKDNSKTLNLNWAGEDRLRALPGVDAAVARRIVLARTKKPFKRVDDLLEIEGVDRALLENIRPLVRVGKY